MPPQQQQQQLKQVSMLKPKPPKHLPSWEADMNTYYETLPRLQKTYDKFVEWMQDYNRPVFMSTDTTPRLTPDFPFKVDIRQLTLETCVAMMHWCEADIKTCEDFLATQPLQASYEKIRRRLDTVIRFYESLKRNYDC